MTLVSESPAKINHSGSKNGSKGATSSTFQSVQEAFARLRKQWKADPADTARVLCEKQSAFLQTDLSELLAGFEQTVYGNRCDAETADRVFRAYCAAYDAYKSAVKRQRKAERAARKAARKVQAEST